MNHYNVSVNKRAHVAASTSSSAQNTDGPRLDGTIEGCVPVAQLAGGTSLKLNTVWVRIPPGTRIHQHFGPTMRSSAATLDRRATEIVQAFICRALHAEPIAAVDEELADLGRAVREHVAGVVVAGAVGAAHAGWSPRRPSLWISPRTNWPGRSSRASRCWQSLSSTAMVLDAAFTVRKEAGPVMPAVAEFGASDSLATPNPGMSADGADRSLALVHDPGVLVAARQAEAETLLDGADAAVAEVLAEEVRVARWLERAMIDAITVAELRTPAFDAAIEQRLAAAHPVADRGSARAQLAGDRCLRVTRSCECQRRRHGGVGVHVQDSGAGV